MLFILGDYLLDVKKYYQLQVQNGYRKKKTF